MTNKYKFLTNFLAQNMPFKTLMRKVIVVKFYSEANTLTTTKN